MGQQPPPGSTSKGLFAEAVRVAQGFNEPACSVSNGVNEHIEGGGNRVTGVDREPNRVQQAGELQFFVEGGAVANQTIDLERMIERVPFWMSVFREAHEPQRREQGLEDAETVADGLFVEIEGVDVDPERINADGIGFSARVTVEVGPLQLDVQFAGVRQSVARDAARAESPGGLADCLSIILLTARRDEPTGLDNDLPTQGVDLHEIQRKQRWKKKSLVRTSSQERFRGVKVHSGIVR